MHPGLEIFVARRAGRIRQVVIERQIGIDKDLFSGGNVCLHIFNNRIAFRHLDHTPARLQLVASIQGAQQ